VRAHQRLRRIDNYRTRDQRAHASTAMADSKNGGQRQAGNAFGSETATGIQDFAENGIVVKVMRPWIAYLLSK